MKRNRAKRVSYSEVSNVAMVAGNERKHSLVIHNGVVKRWVGIGWVEEGKPTKEQKLSLPKVT